MYPNTLCWLRPSSLVVAACLLWFAISTGCPAPPPPTANQCDPEAFASHPDWRAFAASAENTKQANACLQVTWRAEGFVGGTTMLVRLTPSGELLSVDDPKKKPFTALKYPDNARRFAYRFRVFVFAGQDAQEQARLCRAAMAQPTYECLGTTLSQGCSFYYEFRPTAPLFQGRTTLINDNPSLACQLYLRPAPEPTPEPQPDATPEPTPEPAPPEDAPDTPEHTDAADAADVPERPDTPEQNDRRGCVPDTVRVCYTGLSSTRGIGACRDGKQICKPSGEWGICEGQRVPIRESCNNQDDDCDGQIDAPFSGPMCDNPSGPGSCQRGLPMCAKGGEICVGRNPVPFEVCENQVDDNCNGKKDTDNNCHWLETGGSGGEDLLYAIFTNNSGETWATGHLKGPKVSFRGLSRDPTPGNTSLFVVRLDATGSWKWASIGGANKSDISAFGIVVDSKNHAYITGFYLGDATLGTIKLPTAKVDTLFVAKLDPQGKWLWAKAATGGTSWGYSILLNGQNELVLSGQANASIVLDDTHKLAPGNTGNTGFGFVARLNAANGVWKGIFPVPLNRGALKRDFDSRLRIKQIKQGDLLVAGTFAGTFAPAPQIKRTSKGGLDVFVAQVDLQGRWVWATSGGGPRNDTCVGLDNNEKGVIVLGIDMAPSQLAYFGPHFVTAGAKSPGVLARLNDKGLWQWARRLNDLDFETTIKDVGIDRLGRVYAIGAYVTKFKIGNSFLDKNTPGNIFFISFNDRQWLRWLVGGSGGKGAGGVPPHVLHIQPWSSVIIGGNTSKSRFGTISFTPRNPSINIFISKNPHR